MYYAAQADSTAGTYCIGVAQAAAPTGPVTDVGHPLLCGAGRGTGNFTTIDPQSFDDPQTGKRYLYWGSAGQPLVVQELAADRQSFAPGSAPVPVVLPRAGNDPNAYVTGLIEGAWVTYHASSYYLYFSGNACTSVDTVLDVPIQRSTFEVHPGIVVTLETTPLAESEALRAGAPVGRHTTDASARAEPADDGSLSLTWRDGPRGVLVRLRGPVDEAELRALRRRVRPRAEQ